MTVSDAVVTPIPLPVQVRQPAQAPDGALRYDATVPRQLVHRAAVSEVFLTDSRDLGGDRFAVAAQLPRGHCTGEGPFYDPMLIVETVRQSGVLIAHRYFGVETGTPFIFRTLDFRIRDLSGTRMGSSPAKAWFSLHVVPERNRAGRLQGMTFRGEGCLDETACLEGEGRLVFLSPATYAAMRARGRRGRLSTEAPVAARLEAADPHCVGRRDPRNVVITRPAPQPGGGFAATVVVDTTHPYLFDHPLDHVPGNLELEACRQLSVAAVAQTFGLAPESLSLVGCRADFGEFAELDVLTRVSAEVGALRHDADRGQHVAPVSVQVRQGGSVVASAIVEVAA